jgi:hypothetical protein
MSVVEKPSSSKTDEIFKIYDNSASKDIFSREYGLQKDLL